MDKKWIAIIILSLLVIIFAYLAYRPTKEYGYEKEVSRTIDSLIKENKSLREEKKQFQKQNSIKSKHEDSLQTIKPIIQIRYANTYEKINSASINQLIYGFDSLFTNSGIK